MDPDRVYRRGWRGACADRAGSSLARPRRALPGVFQHLSALFRRRLSQRPGYVQRRESRRHSDCIRPVDRRDLHLHDGGRMLLPTGPTTAGAGQLRVGAETVRSLFQLDDAHPVSARAWASDRGGQPRDALGTEQAGSPHRPILRNLSDGPGPGGQQRGRAARRRGATGRAGAGTCRGDRSFDEPGHSAAA